MSSIAERIAKLKLANEGGSQPAPTASTPSSDPDKAKKIADRIAKLQQGGAPNPAAAKPAATTAPAAKTNARRGSVSDRIAALQKKTSGEVTAAPGSPGAGAKPERSNSISERIAKLQRAGSSGSASGEPKPVAPVAKAAPPPFVAAAAKEKDTTGGAQAPASEQVTSPRLSFWDAVRYPRSPGKAQLIRSLSSRSEEWEEGHEAVSVVQRSPGGSIADRLRRLQTSLSPKAKPKSPPRRRGSSGARLQRLRSGELTRHSPRPHGRKIPVLCPTRETAQLRRSAPRARRFSRIPSLPCFCRLSSPLRLRLRLRLRLSLGLHLRETAVARTLTLSLALT